MTCGSSWSGSAPIAATSVPPAASSCATAAVGNAIANGIVASESISRLRIPTISFLLGPAATLDMTSVITANGPPSRKRYRRRVPVPTMTAGVLRLAYRAVRSGFGSFASLHLTMLSSMLLASPPR